MLNCFLRNTICAELLSGSGDAVGSGGSDICSYAGLEVAAFRKRVIRGLPSKGEKEILKGMELHLYLVD